MVEWHFSSLQAISCHENVIKNMRFKISLKTVGNTLNGYPLKISAYNMINAL